MIVLFRKYVLRLQIKFSFKFIGQQPDSVPYFAKKNCHIERKIG